MKNFKWNNLKEQWGSFWDPQSQQIESFHSEIRSNKSIVNNPSNYEIRVAVEALCRVISELVEIEENRV